MLLLLAIFQGCYRIDYTIEYLPIFVNFDVRYFVYWFFKSCYPVEAASEAASTEKVRAAWLMEST